MDLPPKIHAGAPATPTLVADGSVRLGFRRRGAATELAELEQRSPLRAFLPRPERAGIPTAILANTSGGVVGGDRLRTDIALGHGAEALITSQAAEKVYRSAGPTAAIETRLRVADHAWLDWLPQETILFDGARLERRLELDIAAGGRILAGEILVFGRLARGETLTSGVLRDGWRIRHAGRPVFADVLRFDRPAAQLAAPFGFAGARALATLVYVGADAASHLADARDLLAGAPGRVGTSCLPPVLITRWLDPDPARLRDAYLTYRARLREALTGVSSPPAPASWAS
jgi:urease accessory protein